MSAPTHTASQSVSMHVLVADDSQLVRDLVHHAVAMTPCQMLTARNGQEALQLLQESEGVLLVLMDMDMPLMDGMSCVQHIRALEDPVKAHVPIIALTGNADEHSAQEYEEAGFNELVVKPINLALLLRRLQRYLPQPPVGS